MTLREILRQARPWHQPLLILMALALVESLVALTVPWFAGRLAEGFFSSIKGPDWALVAFIIGLLAAVAVLRSLSALIAGKAGLGILAELRAQLHDHVLGLSLGFHQERQRGDLMALLTWEVGRLSSYLTTTLVSVLPSLVTALGAALIMASIDLRLALLVPLLVPVFFLLTKVLGRRLRGLSADVQKAEAAVMASVQQSLEILPAIKTFTREPETAAEYRAALDRARRVSLGEVSAYAIMSPASQFVTASAAVLLLALTGHAMTLRDLSAGNAVSFLLYAALLTRPVAALADVWGRTQVARGVLERLGSVLGTPVEQGGASRITRATGEVRFEGVHYAYPGRPAVLAGVDLRIAPGECVALTGANGAGKTTLTALMMGLMAPARGRILLDGQDVASLQLRDLRRQFGHVPQRPLLFDGTIRENIAFGLPGASEAQIRAAALAAQADAFIQRLPEGYETRIGDSGVRLSGGQSQRVALARALIKDPPILVLDEATSMYDLEGESAFVAAAASALRGRTVILITHRPATLALADRVLVLENGELRTR